MVRGESRQIARVWHPDPLAALVPLKNGSNAEVLIGEPAYQLVTGEIVKP